MSRPDASIRISVEPANPGQFFACCGLLELADRHWNGVEGWFERSNFCLATCAGSEHVTTTALLQAIHGAPMEQIDPQDAMTSPLYLATPFNLRLDWWKDAEAGGTAFKSWAGQQKVTRIARAMKATFADAALNGETLFNTPAVMFDPDQPGRTVEPFYFDARRASQAHGIDIGFSPDAQKMSMPVYAQVEFLCLVGLQRFRPSENGDRSFEYCTWPMPLQPASAAAVASGAAGAPDTRRYQFRLLFRTKYLKGFLPATLMEVTDE